MSLVWLFFLFTYLASGGFRWHRFCVETIFAVAISELTNNWIEPIALPCGPLSMTYLDIQAFVIGSACRLAGGPVVIGEPAEAVFADKRVQRVSVPAISQPCPACLRADTALALVCCPRGEYDGAEDVAVGCSGRVVHLQGSEGRGPVVAPACAPRKVLRTRAVTVRACQTAGRVTR